ncbi:PREDICTED: PC-esterase domain-containing protein 1B [Chrysochloris asiatica]|uniref:PC-esterase domain-containing protein 1B n=1 Tax=Chrysochloris asiatica TaxID=185453 RepID=A0A9B0WQQ1_CHRAS|nr:PREDICTED: PC-esterase domain-containing protein 1B [Chrysochloris asiatica]
MVYLSASEARQLLHNKFVVVLGDSIQRAVYKDLVLLLQKDRLLTTDQLKTKYLEAILEELHSGEYAPDVFIMNSCLWDLSRYGQDSWKSYLENLASLFRRLDQMLPKECLLLWNTAMPVGEKITGGFALPELCTTSLHKDVVEANFHSYAEAQKHGFDVLDLHFHFRHSRKHRQRDGVHWNERVHRHLSQLLLAHVADAWGVDLPDRPDPVNEWLRGRPVRGRGGLGVERQPQASRDQHALLPLPTPPPLMSPLSCQPQLRFPPPTPPLAQTSLAFPIPQPHPMPLSQDMPHFLPPTQDSYSFSGQPPQSGHTSDYFHLDDPLPAHTEFAMEGNFMFSPQSYMPSAPTPCFQTPAPLVHRGFPRNPPYNPYTTWRRGAPVHWRSRRSRTSKKQASRVNTQ